VLELVHVPLDDTGEVADDAGELLVLHVEGVAHDDGGGQVELQADGDRLHGRVADAGHQHGRDAALEDPAAAATGGGAHRPPCP
jgi:hypothetical protein